MDTNLEWIKITMAAKGLSCWNYLLQKGFWLTGESGISVRRFLREVLKFEDGFIDRSVRTVFLNNSPVDNLDETCIKGGDSMALGGAMPGLVGIVMGRDNPYKSFRSDISARQDAASVAAAPAILSVKVFSTLAVETGRAILGQGILVDAAVLAAFLRDKKSLIVEATGGDADTFINRLGTMSGKVPIRVEFC